MYYYITGPSSLMMLQATNGNIIYLFGEIHNLEEDNSESICYIKECFNIDDVLIKIFEYKRYDNILTVSFDIEIYKYKIKNKGKKTFFRLYDIYDKFHDEFFGINKKYKNVFFNKSDIRNIDGYSLFFHIGLQNLFNDLAKRYSFKIADKIVNHFLKILLDEDIYLKLINIYIFSDNFIEDIKILLSGYENIIMKEFLAINLKYLENFYKESYNGKTYSITGALFHQLKEKNIDIYTKLNDFIMGKIKKHNGVLKAQLNELLLKNNNFDKDVTKIYAYVSPFFVFLEKSLSLKDNLITMFSLVLDIHVLSNFFVNEYEFFDINIFYFGHYHVRNYFKFFKLIGFQVLADFGFTYNEKGEILNSVNIDNHTNLKYILKPYKLVEKRLFNSNFQILTNSLI